MIWKRRELDTLGRDIRDHIERETRENIDGGMPANEARLAALRKFGNVARVMEESRGVWQRAWIEQLLQDVRYGARILRRDPRFALVVVLTLALGIGINTAVFSVVNTVLLKPVAYPDADRLVWIADYDPNIQRDYANRDDYLDWRRGTHSYSGMAAYGWRPTAIATQHGASQLTAVFAAGDFWRITGSHAALGRLFGGEETDCLVLTWESFERDFRGDASVIGKPIVMNGRPATITGVLPGNFRFQFPMWWAADRAEPVEAFVSMPRPGEGIAQNTNVVAALKPGVPIAQAQAEIRSLHQHLLENPGRRRLLTQLRVEPIQEKLAGSARPALLVLLAAGVLVLLIASVNVANLLLARSAVRQKEVAIRAAVGAGRTRVIRQLLAESVLQALAGGAAGLLLARWAIAILVRISPYAIPRLAETTIDGRVLAFTLALSLLTGILFGAGPSIALWRSNLHEALKDGGRNSAGLSGRRIRRVLVAVELSVAIVLLTGAGLMLKSFVRMNERAPGFDPANVIVMKLRLAGQQYRETPAQEAYFREVRRRIEEAPGVQSAGLSTWVRLSRTPAFPADTSPDRTHVIRVNATTPGYLKALGMRLVKGRWLTDADSAVALLNESQARQAFGTMDPIGRQISIPRPVTVVGILADVKYSKLDAEAAPEFFVPYRQNRDQYMADVAVRAAGDPAAVMRVLNKLISEIDPSQAISGLKTLEQALADSIVPRRFNLFLLATFAAAALVLALIGIYGVIAYSVAERTREIGVRMALGARRGQVVGMVVREALPIASAGIVAGLIAAWGLTRLMASLLYGVEANDPATFAAVAATLGIMAVVACVGPALKAAWIDPSIALRWE